MSESTVPTRSEVLIVGAGPAGSAAAAWAARAGHQVLLADAAHFPRDKACGDGLTPRAVAELRTLGLGDWLAKAPQNWGLRACGFGRELYLPWPSGSLPATGSAVPRTELDDQLRSLALRCGAAGLSGARAISVRQEAGRVRSVRFRVGDQELDIACDRLIVADGAKSQLGRLLGREWRQDTVFGVAIRGYARSARSTDPWINSHLELRDANRALLSGYGWVFPLGGGKVNLGVGTLATSARPAKIQLRPLLTHYATARRREWQIQGDVQAPRSALLPMGGAVSG
ncbi:MAG: FAD-dependent monooxygenase, partial [Angustibacter sp.]